MTQTTHPENSGYVGDFRYRYSVREYEEMAAKGAFEGKRVELLCGDVHVLRNLDTKIGGPDSMAAMGNPHFTAMRVLSHELYGKLSGPLAISCQLPFNLDGRSQPEPDFTLVKRENAHSRLPTAREVMAVIEVSDSTLRFDQTDKLKAYAENGIPEYWILDLEQMQLEIYREPKGNAYLFKHVLQKGQSARLLEFPDILLEWWGFEAQE